MDETLQLVSVNQDPGISPGRCKGAAVHLGAMRHAFRQLGASVMEIDESDEGQTEQRLEDIHGRTPIGVIYERYTLGRSLAARFAMKRNIPYALEVNAPLAEEQARWRGKTENEKDASEDRVTFGAAAFIGAVSSQIAEYARVRGGRSDAICICPNGIDTSRFKIGIQPDRHLSPTLPPGRFVLGFHGRERPWHGFGTLVDVTRELLAHNQPVHLFIIGNGEFRELTRLPPGSYTRTDWVDHEKIPACISSFHALPLTYSADMPCYFSPLKLMEGMACGVVPLVPELGDLPVVVQHGVTGLVYRAGDSRMLFEQLIALIADPGLRQQMSVKAASAARAHDWKGIAETVLNRLGLSANEPRRGKAIAR